MATGLGGTSIWFLYITGTMQVQTVQQLPFRDEYSLDLQRAYDMVCLARGVVVAGDVVGPV